MKWNVGDRVQTKDGALHGAVASQPIHGGGKAYAVRWDGDPIEYYVHELDIVAEVAA